LAICFVGKVKAIVEIVHCILKLLKESWSEHFVKDSLHDVELNYDMHHEALSKETMEYDDASTELNYYKLMTKF
jgi:hypothetical protein